MEYFDVRSFGFHAQLLFDNFIENKSNPNIAYLSIPNKELINVWKDFILTSVVKRVNTIRTIFDNINDLNLFSADLEDLLSDKLSYHNIGSQKNKTPEKLYHIFVLGVLSAYNDISFNKFPLSNRESGDGRYNILFERESFSVIFEFKSVLDETDIQIKMDEGLKQIR